MNVIGLIAVLTLNLKMIIVPKPHNKQNFVVAERTTDLFRSSIYPHLFKL
jgi:hypothetical protein